jgi:6-phosphogluconolactonase (cycloisomerase 2 family)
MRRSLSLSAALVALVLSLAGSASATPRLYAPLYFTEPPATKVFDLGADGSMTEISGSPFATVAGPKPYPVTGTGGLAFAPDGGRAIVSFFFAGGIQGLSVAPGGGVSPAGAPISGASFSGLAMSPDGRFAYLSNGLAGGIRAYSVAADGSVATLGGGPFGSGEARDLALTPDGRYLYVTSVGEVRRFSIAADGTPTPVGTTMTSSPATLAPSPDGRFLFVGKQGSGSGVASFSIGNDGSLTQNGEPALTGDLALGYFAVAADGAHVYMPDSNVDKIVVASVAADGKLTVIGSTPALNVESVMPSADGRFLYWATDQNAGHIDSMSIGADGIPVPLPVTQPWDSGEPERLVLHPEPVPVASFTARPAAPGAESRFDASGSSRAVRYDWDFGDGTTLADGGATQRHTYAKAGVYDVKLTVTDAQGCSSHQVYTGQSTVCPGGSAAAKTVKLDTLPAITALSVSRRAFATASAGAAASSKKSKVGTVFRYKLSEAAKVKFKIERRKGKKFKQAGPPLSAKGKKGKNKLRFSGKLRHKALPPGSYRATAVAIDSSGGRSASRSVSFRIVGG